MDRTKSLFFYRFKKHKLGYFSLYFIVFLYLLSVFAGFISPHHPHSYNSKTAECPPHIIRFINHKGDFTGYPLDIDIDWIAAYQCENWDSSGEKCLDTIDSLMSKSCSGSTSFGSSLTLLGDDGQSYAQDYLQIGETPVFVVYDKSEEGTENEFYIMYASDLISFNQNQFYNINIYGKISY